MIQGSFLSAFVKLQKATITFVTSVCPSAWNKSAPTGRIFIKFNIRVFFEKSMGKVQFPLISDKNNKYSTRRPMYIYKISLNSS
jgi:hypothetical protein